VYANKTEVFIVLFGGGIPSDEGEVLPKNLMGYRIVSACMTACRYGGEKKTAYRASKK
jgi:hypothetical protein